MAKLEDLVVGSRATGILPNQAVEIISNKWCGSNVLQIVYQNDSGDLGKQMVYREDENQINIENNHLPWSFDADGNDMKLVSEAYRINLAYLFDPYLAVHTSSVEPLPHQIAAVYQEMLPRIPLRYVIADDPGAGKTIMTGLFLKELIVRGDLKKCLIVSPGSLAEQWQDELYQKFNLKFEILTNEKIENSATGNVFLETNYLIARLDKLARNDKLQEKLKMVDWDLVVIDEAHKCSASVWGGEVKYTKRYNLAKLLSNNTRNFLMLTATPHNGKDEDFQLFMALIDQDRFEGVHHNSNRTVDVSDVMRRLVKEELLKFDGKPLFPERRASTVNYDLSPREAELYQAVTDYVQQEFNRADKLTGERKNTVGFALTSLQRRLASSPEAIYQSLKRRTERLEERLDEENINQRAKTYSGMNGFTIKNFDDFDEDDYSAEEMDFIEEEVNDQASASITKEELEAEIKTLKRLTDMASSLRASGEDRKWDELSKLLQDDTAITKPDGSREKLIIFTEYKDTLIYLKNKIVSLLGTDEAVVTIQGGMLRDERRKVEEQFKQDKNVQILIATDAAGEGINLQQAHLMVNYDLPWNPNRLEQRFGRIHRIGQVEVCHLWNMVSKETREGQVFQKLFAKLDEERLALGGKVFDILGKVTFDNKSLKELLIEAIRYGNDPKVRAKLNKAVDSSLNIDELKRLLKEQQLTEDTINTSKVMEIREEMERMEARKLQPYFIESFFLAVFPKYGGQIRKREKGRYEIKNVPSRIINRDAIIGTGVPVLKRYERVCFDKEFENYPGSAQAELIGAGHPLLSALIDLVMEQSADIMKRGTIFIDENDFGVDPRLLFYIESAVQDGIKNKDGSRRLISKNINFVELKEDGTSLNAGYAPYLDYRPITTEEKDIIWPFVESQAWLTKNVEDRAMEFAVSEILPPQIQQIREKKMANLKKTEKAVLERLTSEIQYWDARSADLRQKELAGKKNSKLNSMQASRRADNLQGRLQKRMEELEKEKMISSLPPVVTGGALVIPAGLLHKLTGTKPDTFSQGDKRAVELAAMKAVMDIERELGYLPIDVSMKKVGYDVESKIPDEKKEKYSLRMIEVKGRQKGADTVTVSKNEIMTALNKPEEFLLAVVEVDGRKTRTIYLKTPFKNEPDFTATSVNYNIRDLIGQSQIVLEK